MSTSRRSRVWRLLSTLSPLVQLGVINAKEAQNATQEWADGNDSPLREITEKVPEKYDVIAVRIRGFCNQ